MRLPLIRHARPGLTIYAPLLLRGIPLCALLQFDTGKAREDLCTTPYKKAGPMADLDHQGIHAPVVSSSRFPMIQIYHVKNLMTHNIPTLFPQFFRNYFFNNNNKKGRHKADLVKFKSIFVSVFPQLFLVVHLTYALSQLS
ncbi:hypothetical protein ACI2LM_15945 [Paenibacillus lautus]|uniref:hypothetical protein n=1 Tax=Paenibacillus lautus TaxID=1401 RepID=UPI00384F8E4D